MQAVNTYVKHVTEWLFKHSAMLEKAINLKMKFDPYHKYVASSGCTSHKKRHPGRQDGISWL